MGMWAKVLGTAWKVGESFIKSGSLKKATAHLGGAASFKFHINPLQVLGFGASFLGHAPMSHKVAEAGITALSMWAGSGMSSQSRQMLWGIALAQTGNLMKGTFHAYRNSLEARTSAAIPFSHSSIGMDQALATMSYARSRIGSAYSSLGSEAIFAAARYTSRG